MRRTLQLSIFVLIFTTNIISAEIIHGIEMEFVKIGFAGNPADTGGTPGCGAVAYNYRIGKQEVTNLQWNTFVSISGPPMGNPINAYDEDSIYTGLSQPTNNVSWYEAAQFCNYLTSGDKSKGAYLFNGNNENPGDFLGINRNQAVAIFGTVYIIPTEDEWYKAAYFKTDGSGYSLYANGTNTPPIMGIEANYGLDCYPTWNVGTGAMEQNGTFDMMGNVWEWTETFIGSNPIVRGGASRLDSPPHITLSSTFRYHHDPPYFEGDEDDPIGLGFRVASVPEPTTLFLLSIGGLLLRKRNKKCLI